MIKQKVLAHQPLAISKKVLSQCMAVDLNIYNQAHLTRIESPKLINALPIKSNNEIAITFNLEGELKGSIVCLVNLENSDIDIKNAMRIQSLITESMNILLGQFLTNLEEETGLMSILSNPKVIGISDKLPSLMSFKKKTDINIKTRYQLITSMERYDCLIIIQANQTAVKEV
jgi:chemotaxis protein CheY-P-specific phosphatase CheC